MQEKYENAAKLENISPGILEAVLDFAYTGTVNVTEDTVCELLDAAEFTQLQGTLIAL